MILYVQTPAIPRSNLHNDCIKTMMGVLNQCAHFSEIRWFVNIDVIKETNYSWENHLITESNFKDIAGTLSKIKLNLNTSHNPCFYLAFRHLTLNVIQDLNDSKLKDTEYCVMWLEDDWNFIDVDMFNANLTKFLLGNQYQILTLHGENRKSPGKINMGGNPDIIKGGVHKLFENIDLSKSNKRDPENIRKFNIWYPYIFEVPDKFDIEQLWDGHSFAYNDLTKLLKLINDNKNHPLRISQRKILTSNVVEGIKGDNWRINIKVDKNWDSWDKLGLDSNKSFTYK
jgi:hypothetical protein